MRRFGEAFLWHLRRERLRLALLALAVCAFMGLLVAISRSIRPSEIQEIYERLPPALQALIGFEKGVQIDLRYWLAIINNHPIWLIGILTFPLVAGLRGIAGGIADGTLEPVLAQPLSRTSYYMGLATMLALGALAAPAASFLGGLITGSLVELPSALPVSTLLAMSVSGLALALAVMGMTLLASAASSRRPATWIVSILVVMFFVRFLAHVWPAFARASPLSIFHYHDTQRIVRDGLSAGSIAALLAVALVCGGAGLLVFRRRQLTF